MRTSLLFVLFSCSGFAQLEPVDLATYFSLTEAQISQLDQLKAANRQENAERSIKRSALLAEFSRLLLAEPLDESRLGENQVAQIQLDRDDAAAQTKLMERTLTLLDSDQRAKLDVLAGAQKLDGLIRQAECQNFLVRRPVFFFNGVTTDACPGDDFSGFVNSLKKSAETSAVSPIPTVVVQYLGLSPSQLESLQAVRESYIRAQAAKQVDRAAKVSTLYGSEFDRPVLDAATIGKLIGDIIRLDRSFPVSDQEFVKKLRSGLTEEQITKLDLLGPAVHLAANEAPVRCAGFFPQRWGTFSMFWGPSLREDPYRTTGCSDPQGWLNSVN